MASWMSAPGSEPALSTALFELLRCEICGTAVTAGAPVSGLHESGAYRPGAPRLSRALAPVLRAFDRRRLAMLAPLISPGARVLDVGAGRGRFVAIARAAGYDAIGIEPSLRGAQPAFVTPVAIEEAEFGPGAFDAVTAWHVLEHLDDPGAALARSASWLAPRGSLLVGVPNIASWQARIGGPRWFHLDVPRHRVHFSPRGLEALLAAHGFAIVHTHHLLLEHNPFGMWQSLVNRMTQHPSYLYNALKRNAPLRSRDLAVTALALAVAPLAVALEALAGLKRRGGTIAVVARRVQ
jgi:2-polyprenyl-3-methyl-5-hydroxy-6-metoxy-1,4-benzoquinol methylase